MRKGRDGGGKKEKTNGNSGHYVIASSRPLTTGTPHARATMATRGSKNSLCVHPEIFGRLDYLSLQVFRPSMRKVARGWRGWWTCGRLCRCQSTAVTKWMCSDLTQCDDLFDYFVPKKRFSPFEAIMSIVIYQSMFFMKKCF